MKNISLSFVGWGNEKSEYYKSIKAQIGNRNIRFVQFVDNMESIYAKTDIVLVCSLETFGRVSIEAMKHSIPIVAANVGASSYNIKNGFNGFLYKKNNPVDLANKIMLLQNPDVRNEIGRNGYMFAMENYNEKNMIDDFMEPLSNL
jgi:glycosyltransferase involved in cell wall biosynthesis